jgi:outer membrane protein OmpA-like peptidoglycan-associated protein
MIRSPRSPLACSTAGLVLLCAAAAHAQGFDAQIHRPTASTSGYYSQESGKVLRAGDLNVGLTLDFAHNPLVLRDPDTGEIVTDGGVVASRLVSQLGAAVGLFGFLEARLRLPLILYQQGDLEQIRPAERLRTTTLGDMELLLKARLLGKPGEDGFQLALAAGVNFPTGSSSSFTGDGKVNLRPRLIIGFQRQRLSAAVNGGYNVRPDATIPNASLAVGDELAGGLGLSYQAVPQSLWVLGEAYLARAVDAAAGARSTPAEAVVGARYALPGPWMLQGGLGIGLSSGVGAPGVRGILMLAYASDLDRPGLAPWQSPVAAAAVPPAIEPPPSPKAPPPDPDTDGDGILDSADRCPSEAEDKDGFEDDDGCPDPDNDKDALEDASDRCPLEAEDKDSFEDDDGCPEKDNDKDGFADAADKCPSEAEIFNGITDDDGCPDKGAPLVIMRGDRLEIRQQINFDTNKASIKKSSFSLLATVAKLLVLNPEIAKVRVEGHTDRSGQLARNMKLSQERADSVRQHLVDVNGIEAGRLEAAGFGPTQPLEGNTSKTGRAKNRRVEFIIVDKTPAAEGTPAPTP